jgi:hypothetical protein
LSAAILSSSRAIRLASFIDPLSRFAFDLRGAPAVISADSHTAHSSALHHSPLRLSAVKRRSS